jgi:rhodanese-related sulfurtransferase
MRKSVVIALAFFVGLATLAARAQMKVQPKPPSASIPLTVNGARNTATEQFPRIDQDDAYKLYQQQKAVFVDVRSHSTYERGHIKGALSIPGSQIIGRFKEIPPGKTIIAYCACSAEQASGHATITLLQHGVKNVFALEGGWHSWENAGHPTATGSK